MGTETRLYLDMITRIGEDEMSAIAYQRQMQREKEEAFHEIAIYIVDDYFDVLKADAEKPPVITDAYIDAFAKELYKRFGIE